jgi:hypothetical protein
MAWAPQRTARRVSATTTPEEALTPFVTYSDNYVVVRSVSWVKKGRRLKYLDVKELERIDGIWVGTEMHMSTRKGETTLHKTVLYSRNVAFGQDLGEDLFTVRQLEKGP